MKVKRTKYKSILTSIYQIIVAIAFLTESIPEVQSKANFAAEKESWPIGINISFSKLSVHEKVASYYK